MEMLNVIASVIPFVAIVYMAYVIIKLNEKIDEQRVALRKEFNRRVDLELAILEQAYEFGRAYDAGGDRDDLVRRAGVMELIYRLGLLNEYGVYVERVKGEEESNG